MRHIQVASLKKDTINPIRFYSTSDKEPEIIRVVSDVPKGKKHETIIKGEPYIVYPDTVFSKVDINRWAIHYVTGLKDPHMANIHTHFPAEFHHIDLQLALPFNPQIAGEILNCLGTMIANGSDFRSGDIVEGILVDCPLALKTFRETGRSVLRVIVPDVNRKFPWDEGCDEVYKKQLEETPEG